MENKKLSALIICGFIGVSLLIGCSQKDDLSINKDKLGSGSKGVEGKGRFIHMSGENFQGARNGNQSSKIQEASLPVNGKLAVLDTCIGCGKCARIAGSNFEMQGGKSIVKSQDNINSQSINHAIAACPVDAIVIQA